MANKKYALEWDAQGQKQYEMGVTRGVLYKYNKTSGKWIGTAWNGLISVTENPEGAEETELWADNIKYGSLRSAEKFSGSIEAYMYPEEFESCDGLGRPAKGMSIGQQKREVFCLCYRTEIGNDQDPEAGYRLHLVYNATCSPSQKQYQTINDSPEAITFSWDFTTTPIPVEGYKPTAHITFDSTDFVSTEEQELLAELEEILYGTPATTGQDPTPEVPAELPLPDDLIDMMNTDND